MADITITAASVAAGSEAVTGRGTAGATITAGQALYQDSADNNKLKLADHSAETTAEAVGIALHGAADGQPLTYLRSGLITIGATTTTGETYYVSTTAGGIAPSADIGTGDYVTILGVAPNTTQIRVNITVSGAAHA